MRAWMVALMVTSLALGQASEAEAAGKKVWTAERDLAASPAAPDAPSLAEAIAAAPDGPAEDHLVPTPDPVDPEFELHLLQQDATEEADSLAASEEDVLAAGADFLDAVAEWAGTVDESRVRESVMGAPAPGAPSLAAEPPAKVRHLKGYRADLQRAFLKYGADGVIPASSVNWLAETYDRRVMEVAHDLRQMARNAGVVIPDFERTDPPPPEPTTRAVIPQEAVADAASPDLSGAYLHALEHVLEKYDHVRLVPAGSLRFLARVHERSEDQVMADLVSLDKPDAESVLPDYAY